MRCTSKSVERLCVRVPCQLLFECTRDPGKRALARKEEELEGERDGDEVSLCAVELPPALLDRGLGLDLLVRRRPRAPAGRRRRHRGRVGR